ncbi:hypothetical protein Y032_0071g584 [Ancylostoma ceylanicum]|nr:hypothetical protein Y032_0071g584 [Ancylostoma ceylanicum]
MKALGTDSCNYCASDRSYNNDFIFHIPRSRRAQIGQILQKCGLGDASRRRSFLSISLELFLKNKYNK